MFPLAPLGPHSLGHHHPIMYICQKCSSRCELFWDARWTDSRVSVMGPFIGFRTMDLPEVREQGIKLIKYYNKKRPDDKFYCSSLSIVFDWTFDWHTDQNNEHVAATMAIGDYDGGGLQVQRPDAGVLTLDIHNKIVLTDTQLPHRTELWTPKHPGAHRTVFVWFTRKDFNTTLFSDPQHCMLRSIGWPVWRGLAHHVGFAFH